jgi:SAM-dependent methyltransferase
MSANSNDYQGHANLEIISENHRFNDWMYRQVNARLKREMLDVLEVGSGLGTFSERIIRDLPPSSHIMLTDKSGIYVQALKGRYSLCKNVSVTRMDLNNRTDYSRIGYEKYDLILALNVLEHISDDQLALRELYKVLKKDGSFVILVPCHKFLFNVIDENVGHFRRYTKRELKAKIRETNFKVELIRYFNFLGIVGWYFNGNLLKNPGINPTASKWFDRMVPLLDYLERITLHRIGLSLICFLKK